MSDDPIDDLSEVLKASGFQIVPIEQVVDLLAHMEEYVCNQAGISHDELDPYLERLEALVGAEELSEMSLDDIAGWITSFKL